MYAWYFVRVLLQLRVGFEVVVAIGEAEAALRQIENGRLGILCVPVHSAADERRHVQHQHARHVARQVGLARERVDSRELRIERTLPQLVDARLVHERCEEISELLLIGSWRLVRRLRGPFRDGAESLLRPVDGLVEPAIGAAVGWDFGLGEPRAIDELVEIVLRTDRLVEAGRVDPGGEWFGRGRRRGAAAGAGCEPSREHEIVRLATRPRSSSCV